MTDKYDYLIVGCGLFGAVFAREATDRGRSCLIVDRRRHIGGNVYTESVEGVNVHKYGAHIFHTKDKGLWDYVNRFAEFNHYRHRVLVRNNGRLLSFPINLMTLYQLWGTTNPAEALDRLERARLPIKDTAEANLEEWALHSVGKELYDTFIRGYTAKQWGRDPRDLPASIIKRIPVRREFNDFYFDDPYQGIPIGGYTGIVKKLISGSDVELNCDFFQHRTALMAKARRVVFTGKLDEFFNYTEGELEYRTLDFEEQVLQQPSFQGTSVINYTEESVPFTRIIEHKYFEFGTQEVTVITREYPGRWAPGREPYYPLNDARNTRIFEKYRTLSGQRPEVIFGGRLAEYRYYDMHQVIASALQKVQKEFRHGQP